MTKTSGWLISEQDPKKCISQTGFGLDEKPEFKAQVGPVGGEPIFGGPPTFKDYNVPKLGGTRRQPQFGGEHFTGISFEAIAKNTEPFLNPTEH